MIYRPDIDGLRALAVLPAIFYHGRVPGFDGGYVGQDVFFVISGYLITTIILTDRNAGKFSLLTFYERRVRRLLPALFLVMAVCIPFAWVIMMPGDMDQFAQSILGVATFSSNFFFWQQSDYFAPAADLLPLLQTWSLAVEEQFYIFYPLILLGLLKIHRQLLIIAITVGILVSFAIAEWSSHAHPTAAYYLLPTRAWELLLGGLAGLYLIDKPVKDNHPLRDVISVLGLAAIIVPIFIYTRTMAYPGVYTLIPALGTLAIVLDQRENSIVARLVGAKPIVTIGLVSYGAYLWHQPIFAFVRYVSADHPSTALMLALSIVSLGLAWLSYRYVETPIRNRKNFSRNFVFAASFILIIGFSAFGLAGYLTKGWPDRFDPAMLKAAEYEKGLLPRCKPYEETGCLIGDQDHEPHISIIGDSHAGVLQKGLDAELLKRGQSALSYTNPWCSPLLDVATSLQIKRPECREITKRVIDLVSRPESPKHVVMVSQWSTFVLGVRRMDNLQAYYTDAQSREESLAENAAVFERGLIRTLDHLLAAGKTVTLVQQLPEFGYDVPKIIAHHQRRYGDLERVQPDSVEEFNQRNQLAISILQRQLQTRPDVRWLPVLPLYCNDRGLCPPYSDAGALFADNNHLSVLGSNRLIKSLLDNLQTQ